MTDEVMDSSETGTILEVRDAEPETDPGAPPWRVKTSTGFETFVTGETRPSEGEPFAMTLAGGTTVSAFTIGGRDYTPANV